MMLHDESTELGGLPASMSSQPQFCFGPYRLDCHARILSRDGVSVPLGGRAFDVLAVLAAARGKVVLKGALLDQVWSRIAVDENNLHAQVSSCARS